jgi:hypothetical protein
MTGAPDMTGIVAAAATERKLRARDDLGEPGWTFWELRNLNMHRVVGLLKASRRFTDARDLEGEIRGAIARNFKRAWWRGLAYGVVVELPRVAWSPDDLKPAIDIYENRKGVLQWLILAEGEARSALGVHTWEEAYLSPVYRKTLDALSVAGWQVARAIKGKDGLLKFLTGASGLKGVSFPEFRDQG